MTFPEEIRKANEALMGLFKKLDDCLAPGLAQYKPPCVRGCDQCCYLLTSILTTEGMMLAEEILSRPDWKELAKKMRTGALAACEPKLTRAAFFRKQLPCPLLDTEKRECIVYDKRPSACRFHYLAYGDVKQCSHEYVDHTAPYINAIELEAHVWKFDQAVFPSPDPSTAPVGLMTLYCMMALTEKDAPERFTFLWREARALPDPTTWAMNAIVNGPMGDGATTDDVSVAVKDALEKVGMKI